VKKSELQNISINQLKGNIITINPGFLPLDGITEEEM
jgi:hypothetical protein